MTCWVCHNTYSYQLHQFLMSVVFGLDRQHTDRHTRRQHTGITVTMTQERRCSCSSACLLLFKGGMWSPSWLRWTPCDTLLWLLFLLSLISMTVALCWWALKIIIMMMIIIIILITTTTTTTLLLMFAFNVIIIITHTFLSCNKVISTKPVAAQVWLLCSFMFCLFPEF